MAQIFHPSANTLAKASIFGAIFILASVGFTIDRLNRSAWQTDQFVAKDQPVPFSHEHHVRGLGIDCRYCHTSVEQSSFAGIPATKTCMTCHSQIWTNAQLLQPVRESWRTNKPIVWQRVHNLPKFVYFNHSIHVAKGVGCSTCHGQIDHMPLTWQVNSLQMEWCLTCHRDPSKFVRPQGPNKDLIYKQDYDPVKDADEEQATLGPKLVEQYHIAKPIQLTNCSVCHR